MTVVLWGKEEETPVLKCEYKNEKMTSVVDFCKKIDKNEPDFLELMINEGKC